MGKDCISNWQGKNYEKYNQIEGTPLMGPIEFVLWPFAFCEILNVSGTTS